MSETEIRNLISNAVLQATQQIAQSVTEQVIQSTQQTGGSLAADKKVLGYEGISHDIGTDEGFNSKSLNDAEMWTNNKKQLVASELTERIRSIDHNTALKSLEIKERQLAIDEREAKIRLQASLDAIAVSERQNAAVINHLANTLSIDFRTAAQHPLNPNGETETK